MVKHSWTEVMYQAHSDLFANTEEIKILLYGGAQSMHVKDLTMTACVKTGSTPMQFALRKVQSTDIVGLYNLKFRFNGIQ
jgi:hypothetical protein